MKFEAASGPICLRAFIGSGTGRTQLIAGWGVTGERPRFFAQGEVSRQLVLLVMHQDASLHCRGKRLIRKACAACPPDHLSSEN